MLVSTPLEVSQNPVIPKSRQERKIMSSNSFSKPKIAILAACLYTAVMGIGMFYMKNFKGITYGEPEMMNVFWFVMIAVNAINIMSA